MRKEEKVFWLLIIVYLFILGFYTVGCEFAQTTHPSSVNVTISEGEEGVETGEEVPGESGTITLDPPSGTVAVGKTLNVMVVVRDANGTEVPSENISVNILDKTVVSLTEIDGRILAFSGVSPGVTSVIVTASGLQTSMVITVTD